MENESTLKYNTLLPFILTENDNPEAFQSVQDLHDVIKDAKTSKIANIAITGPYGSGKSSILLTLQKNHPEYNYISISLATLADETGIELDENCSDSEEIESDGNDSNGVSAKKGNIHANNSSNRSKEDLEKLNKEIERSILQQIFYKEKASSLPSSRFKRIPNYSFEDAKKKGLWVLSFIVAFAIAFEPSFLKIDSFCYLFNFENWLKWGKWVNAFVDLIAVVWLLFCCIKLVWYFLQNYGNSKLNKLSAKDLEIQTKEEETSIFNRHLDEILYFFQRTNYDVVLIEDLDRFNTTQIFLKLRELNLLINNSEEINRHVVFVYAVRDNIFKDEDRTKFFDYIIPVIPVINPSNSTAILKKELANIGIGECDIADSDLSEIGYFIKDMRILKNIVNEFKHYYTKLTSNGCTLSQTKMLAMIVYKNYFPGDFANLHLRKGMVYSAITNRTKYSNIVIEALKEKEKILKQELNLNERNVHLQEQELRLLYIANLLSQYQQANQVLIDNQWLTPHQIAFNDASFSKFLALHSVEYRFLESSNAYQAYASSRTKSLNPDVNTNFLQSDYFKRINSLGVEKTKTIKLKIEEIKKEKARIKSMKISELLEKYKEVRTSPIYANLHLPECIDIFLKRGYIDEDYYDYISYFYNGLLSPKDYEYLLSIRALEEPQYDYEIDEIDNFVKELAPRNFNTDSILNIHLLEYFIQHKADKTCEEFAERMFDILIEAELPTDFIYQYYMQKESRDLFFVRLFCKKDNAQRYWDKINLGPKSPVKDTLFEAFFAYCGEIDEYVGPLEWLNNNFEFLREHKNSISEDQLNDLISPCKFKSMDSIDPELVLKTMEFNAYEVNAENLHSILSSCASEGIISNDRGTLTNLLSIDIDEFNNYVLKENLPDLFPLIDLSYKNELQEAIIYILKSGLSIENKTCFLSGQTSRIDYIEDLSEEDAKLAFKLNLIVPSWTNINSFYVRYAQQKIIASYLDVNHATLANANDFEQIAEMEADIFAALVVNSNESTLESLCPKFNIQCSGNGYLSSICLKKLEILDRSNKLPFSQKNITAINQDLLPAYILTHSKEFMAHLSYDYAFNVNNAFVILSSSKFNDQEKIEILKRVGIEIIRNSLNLCNILVRLSAKYPQQEIFDIDTTLGIMKLAKNIEDKAMLATHYIITKGGDVQITRMILEALNTDYFTKLAYRNGQPKIPVNENNLKLLECLQKYNYISTFKQERDFYRVFQKHSSR